MTRRSAPAAVVARGWGIRHPGRRAWALRGVDLVIEAGQRVLLLGPSGAGKSTLLTAIAGLDDPAAVETEGTLLVDELEPRLARDRSGLLFQDPEAQIVMARAGDEVAFGLENRCVPADAIWRRVDAALAAVDFPYDRDRPTHALSGGEQQRLAIAATLALAPGLLLLDEPTANLDPDAAAEIRAVVGQAVERLGATLVLVEHRVGEWLPIVDRVIVLEAGGGVMADGPPHTVFAEQGSQLADAGVWIPDQPPAAVARGRPPGAETLVIAEDASYRYPDAAMRDALAATSVSLRSSEAVALVGPTGSGKSTLALLLAGLLSPSHGTVIAGEALAAGRGHEPLAGWSARELASHVGTVFQDPEHQFLTGSVRDELLLGPRRGGVAAHEAGARADELLERLRLDHVAEANPFTLSGGEQRRLSVATALATAPRLLVLDEPTFGQDRRTWGELVHLLSALRDDGRGICVATHDRAFEHALADRTLRLGGRP
jgi:energy-coupling factor transport system ATP-binding protein